MSVSGQHGITNAAQPKLERPRLSATRLVVRGLWLSRNDERYSGK
jgi:hypothetical protein